VSLVQFSASESVQRLRAQDNFYPYSHCFFQWRQNSVQGTYTSCCWAIVSLVNYGEGKGVIFLWGWTKLHSHLPWHHIAFRK